MFTFYDATFDNISQEFYDLRKDVMYTCLEQLGLSHNPNKGNLYVVTEYIPSARQLHIRAITTEDQAPFALEKIIKAELIQLLGTEFDLVNWNSDVIQ
jgi:hypothetical protein